MPPSPRLLRGKTALAVVDVQEKLLPAMFEPQRVVANVLRLVRAAPVLHLPIVVTEQNPKGLGPTVPDIAAAISAFKPLDKMQFSAAASAAFSRALKSKDVHTVLLCGIESHVCVSQTCLDLLDSGFQVFVAHDATSSRSPENWRLGTERMRQAGAIIVSAEMAIFELLHTADSPDFKQILDIVK